MTLPTYPFDRERFWIDPAPAARIRRVSRSLPHGLAGERVRSPLSNDIVFQSEISTETVPFLADHVIHGSVIFPASGLIELALSAGTAALETGERHITNFIVREPLFLANGEHRLVQTVLTQPRDGACRFTIYSVASDDASSPWTTHASGDLRVGAAKSIPSAVPNLDEVRTRCATSIAVDEFYESLHASGIEYGSTFRGVQRLSTGEREAVGQITTAIVGSSSGRFVVHPAVLDASFQILAASCALSTELCGDDLFLPLGIEHLSVIDPAAAGSEPFWSYAALRKQEPGNRQTITADLWWLDSLGAPLLCIQGFTVKRASRSVMESMKRGSRRELDGWLHEIDWQPVDRAPVEATDRTPAKWIVLGDLNGVGRQLVTRLRSDRHEAVLVVPGEANESQQVDDGTYVAEATSRECMRRLLQQLLPAAGDRCDVVHLWGLPPADASSERVDQRRSCGSLLAVAQALGDSNAANVRLWTVTIGAQPVEAGQTVDPSQTALWGLAHAVAIESPSLRCTRIDLDPSARNHIDVLADELYSGQHEDQIALRGDRRLVARLVKFGETTGRRRLPLPAAPCWQLAMSHRGTIDNLEFQTAERRAPGRGEVEIRVHSTGLNFRDVLNVLGMYPGDPGPLGSECAGVVTAVGEGVTRYRRGDQVMGMGAGSFKPYLTASADLMMPKPDGLSFEQAAGVPVAFLTALYALKHVGGMKAGDRVLIHAAAGGVGLAAVQLALRAGAEVFGTVGSAAKREVLEAMGVKHVLNSRTLDFADEIMAITGGRGVDIVLNSLTGDFITRSLSVLAADGRFVEIGKADIWDRDRVAAAAPGIAYTPFDLGDVMLRDPVLGAVLQSELLEGLADGTLSPLPVRLFEIDEAPAAFRFMAQARHIGKVVISQPQAAGSLGSDDRVTFRTDGAYLITGGCGALGLAAAAWMIERGARHIVLAGRSEPSEVARDEIASLRQRGASVTVVSADVSREDGARKALDQVVASGLPLRGVVHAAGVLHDAVVTDQTWDDFDRVLSPKVAAALLDSLTRSHPIEHFILFSSVSSVIGAAAQGAYAAGNAFLDGLAHHRRSIGLPAQSINWGPWAERGMAAALSHRDKARMTAAGFDMIATADGLACLERAIGLGARQVAVIPARWEQVCGRFASGRMPPLLRVLSAGQAAPGGKAGTPRPVVSLRSQLEAAPDSEKRAVIIDFVRRQVAKVLGLKATNQLGLFTPFTEFGLDSLMSVELRNALSEATDLELRSSLIYDYGCIHALAEYLSTSMLGDAQIAASSAEPDTTDEPWQAPDDLDDLSERKLAELLSAGLASLNLEGK